MTERTSLTDLPFWPLFLGREEAARYLGVRVDIIDDEVKAGLWPAPQRRGNRGGWITWYRPWLDDAAARAAGIGQTDSPAAARVPAALWKERSDGAATQKRLDGTVVEYFYARATDKPLGTVEKQQRSGSPSRVIHLFLKTTLPLLG